MLQLQHHRNSFRHLSATLRPLRAAVAQMGDMTRRSWGHMALTPPWTRSVLFLRWPYSISSARLIVTYSRPLLLLGVKLLLSLLPTWLAAAEVCAGQLSIRAGKTTASAAPGLLRGTRGTDLIGSLKSIRERMSVSRLLTPSAQYLGWNAGKQLHIPANRTVHTVRSTYTQRKSLLMSVRK